MLAGIAATLDRFAAVVGPRATVARGVLGPHGRREADQAPRSSDVVVLPGTTQEVHPLPDLRG